MSVGELTRVCERCHEPLNDGELKNPDAAVCELCRLEAEAFHSMRHATGVHSHLLWLLTERRKRNGVRT